MGRVSYEGAKVSVRRFWLDPNELPKSLNIGDEFELPNSTFHHVAHVTRLGVGDTFEGINGSDTGYVLKLTQVGKKSAAAVVTNTRALPTARRPYIHLAFAVSKWDVTESVLEKSVELGVSVFQPLLTANSFAKKPNDISDTRFERWQRVVQSATVQTGRGGIMKLLPPVSLSEFLESVHRDSTSACLFAYEGVCPQDLRTALVKLVQAKPENVWALVGSEGGFSEDEVQLIQSFKIIPATMGPQILRAETACLAILSVIKYETGGMTGIQR